MVYEILFIQYILYDCFPFTHDSILKDALDFSQRGLKIIIYHKKELPNE